jgi:integrase
MIVRRTLANGDVSYLVRLSRGFDPVRKNARTGKPRRRYEFKTFATLKEAERWERDQKVALDRGTYVAPTKLTFGDYMTQFLDTGITAKRRARTVHDYRRCVNRYFVGTSLAALPLSQVTTAALEAFYNEVVSRNERPLSARTIEVLHSVLRVALAKAVKLKLIAVNPAKGVELPGERQDKPARPKQQARALTRKELRQFDAAAAGTRYEALWSLLTRGGLRPNEALALRWEDVGPDRVTISRALVSGLKGVAPYFDKPKNKTSARVVTLPAVTMALLGQQRLAQAVQKEAEGKDYQDQGLVFATRTGGPLELKNLARRHFRPILTAAKLPRIRVYDLRHTHVTHLLYARVPVQVVSKRVGHANPTITMKVYAHVLDEIDQDPLKLFEEYLGRELAATT